MTDHAHLSSEELADFDVGLLPAAREAEIAARLEDCPVCTGLLADVRHVSRVLAAQPRPSTPPEVGTRIDAVLAELARTESRVRPDSDDPAGGPGAGATGTPALPGSPVFPERSGMQTQEMPAGIGGGLARSPLPRPTLGPLETNFRRHRRRPARFALAALAACAVAGVVGFGGYLISAVSGHNEPSADTPVVVAGRRLGSSGAVEQPGRLSAHRFSAAWNCARKVTDGRITGIERSVVDGTPGLLVYLDGEGRTRRVVFVTGCSTGAPSAGPSAVIPRS